MINQPSVRFRFFRPSSSKTHIFPKSSLHSRPGQPTKKIVQPWLFIDPSKREFPKKCQIYQNFIMLCMHRDAASVANMDRREMGLDLKHV